MFKRSLSCAFQYFSLDVIIKKTRTLFCAYVSKQPFCTVLIPDARCKMGLLKHRSFTVLLSDADKYFLFSGELPGVLPGYFAYRLPPEVLPFGIRLQSILPYVIMNGVLRSYCFYPFCSSHFRLWSLTHYPFLWSVPQSMDSLVISVLLLSIEATFSRDE